MRSHLKELLTQAIEKTAKGGELNSTDLPPLLLEPPKQREFGDLTTNIAMLWAQKAKKPPRIIAEMVLKNIEDPHSLLARKEIAGRGFLNFTFSSQFIAYHRNKFEGKFNRLIDVWGADHHGYVPRLKAAMQGLGYEPSILQVVLVQMVQLTCGGEPVRMGKRTGEFISLEEILQEVGRDAARFFFLMRKADSHLDFDFWTWRSDSQAIIRFFTCSMLMRVSPAFLSRPAKAACLTAAFGVITRSRWSG